MNVDHYAHDAHRRADQLARKESLLQRRQLAEHRMAERESITIKLSAEPESVGTRLRLAIGSWLVNAGEKIKPHAA